MAYLSRAEMLALQAYEYLSPSLTKLLVKTRLLISKILIGNEEYKKSLKYLWNNVNSLKLECRVRMGKTMDCIKPNDQKLKKWVKYFILNLHQMIHCYVKLGETSAANESALLMEWLAEGFFENKSLFYMSVVDFTHHVCDTSRYYLRIKADNLYHFNNITKKNFHPELYEEFIEKKEKIKTGLGYIPSSSDQESESEKAVEVDVYDAKSPNDILPCNKSYRLSKEVLSKRDSISVNSPNHVKNKSFSTQKSHMTINRSSNPKNKNLSISTNYTSAMTSGILYGTKSPKIPEFDIYINEKLHQNEENNLKKNTLSHRFLLKGKKKVTRRKLKSKSKKSVKKMRKFNTIKSANTKNTKTKADTLPTTLKDVIQKSKADQECKYYN